MSIYLEQIPFTEYGTQFTFKGKQEHTAKLSIPNLSSQNEYINIEISHGLGDHVIASNSVKKMFNLNIESTGKIRSIVNNVNRVLMRKVILLGAKKVDRILNSNIYDTYKDTYFSEKEHEEELLLQKIKSANDVKVQAGAKRVVGTAITLPVKVNAIKSSFVKTFAVP